jgi:hypothetical protein
MDGFPGGNGSAATKLDRRCHDALCVDSGGGLMSKRRRNRFNEKKEKNKKKKNTVAVHRVLQTGPSAVSIRRACSLFHGLETAQGGADRMTVGKELWASLRGPIHRMQCLGVDHARARLQCERA